MAGSTNPDANLSPWLDTPSGPLKATPVGADVPAVTSPTPSANASAITGSLAAAGSSVLTGAYGLLESFDPGMDSFVRLKPGDIVGERYRVQSLIGHGGMGMVYKVEQIFLGKELALKILHSRNVTDVTVRRFQHEARAAFGIDHPSLIAVHDFGLLDQRIPFLVMDYVNGRSLSDKVKERGTLSVHEAVPLFLRICFGLGYAHEQGVIHRDMKPSNIMLVDGLSPHQDGCVKIVDFGIAKFTQFDANEVQALTRTGEVFGSPLYMSPEQCSGSPVDQRADIYSLGCVFFEVLTGTTPFVGANALLTMMQHMGETLPSLKEASMGKEFPPVLEQIIAKMLAKRACERYQSLAQVATDLAALERTLTDPVLMANSVLVVKEAQSAKPQTGIVSMSRTILYLLTSIVIVMSAGISSLLTIQLNGVNSPRRPAVTAPAAKKKTYCELKLVHLDDAKLFVKTLEKKAETAEDARRTVQQVLSVQGKKGTFKLRFPLLSDLTLRAIARSTWISDLDLSNCGFENKSLIWFADMPKLTHLKLSNSNFDDIGAAQVSKCKKVRTLNANWSNITDKAIPFFTIMPELNKLEISGTRLTPLSIQFLADDDRLISLNLRAAAGVDDEAFAPMVDSKLQFINLETIQIGDGAAKYFSKMRNLRSVAIGGTNMTGAGIEELLENKKLHVVRYTITRYLKRSDIRILMKRHPEVRFLEGFQDGGALNI